MNWISIKDQLPKLNKYVLIHIINRKWIDEDDPFYKVASLHKKYDNTFRFEEFGPDCFTLDEVDFWLEIPKVIDNNKPIKLK